MQEGEKSSFKKWTSVSVRVDRAESLVPAEGNDKPVRIVARAKPFGYPKLAKSVLQKMN